MKKRSLLLSLVLTLYLCMAMSMPAWAADVESKTEQIKQGIEAYLLSPDGEKLDLEIVDVKTKPLVTLVLAKQVCSILLFCFLVKLRLKHQRLPIVDMVLMRMPH